MSAKSEIARQGEVIAQYFLQIASGNTPENRSQPTALSEEVKAILNAQETPSTVENIVRFAGHQNIAQRQSNT